MNAEQMISDMNLLPFWKSFGCERPSLDAMITLLEKNNLTAPRSGFACIQMLWANRESISAVPLPKEAILPEPIIPEEEILAEAALSDEILAEPPREIPLIDQCENNILSEAEERLKSCIDSSYRTDNGRIMLENDLLLFENSESWLAEMIKEWHPRLKSTMRDEFSEAIHLWMASHESFTNPSFTNPS